ncbi:phosphonate C-P lyase system protein PhnH [Glaciimonas sp. PAMC28666]|uniref:phosphonate C-P lyase system protein PhnH n=1 Tax=Glaciimonas sp. PAMC28666 TaxID=2807626 RepID=UPI00196275FC|nr:phosphonate C-P lyase system protein PhnH [Glaciimonas sp. PAMC28666]QRX84019.1 phosphonate C-P lyase system protein PhnH [Glaciimonas sp. PAMC28666]
MSALLKSALLPAWNDPVHASQSTFRAVLKALSEPGVIQTLMVDIQAPAPLFLSTIALCLTLADGETTVWLDDSASTEPLKDYLRFHCGCQLVADATRATFAVITDPRLLAEHIFEEFARGTMEYPDRSTTLLVQVQGFSGGPARTLSGPGIPHERLMNVAGLPEHFDAIWQKNVDGFPLGVDLIFCHGSQILGLPRTTNIAVPRL